MRDRWLWGLLGAGIALLAAGIWSVATGGKNWPYDLGAAMFVLLVALALSPGRFAKK